MDKAISTALFIIISMTMALMLFNVAYPAVVEGGDAIASMGNRAGDQMRTDLKVIHAAAELDSSGTWQDTNGNGTFETFIWVKNIGMNTIRPVENLDVFFGAEASFARIPHQSNAGGSTPYWTGTVEGGGNWSPTGTLCITVHYAAPLSSGRYYIQITTPNGVSDEYFIGM